MSFSSLRLMSDELKEGDVGDVGGGGRGGGGRGRGEEEVRTGWKMSMP